VRIQTVCDAASRSDLEATKHALVELAEALLEEEAS
jgi:hypothetical protein